MLPVTFCTLQMLTLESNVCCLSFFLYLQVLLGGPNHVEPRLLAAVRGLVATYQSEVDALTLEVLGSWDRPLNKQNEVWGVW
jgi:hypothetical protein